METRGVTISEPRINERIRVPEVRLVGPNGEQVGIVRVEDALRLAAEADLDLVEVAPMAKPPVAKLMDFGKYKYEAALKAREARRNQVNTVIKEIKLRPKIDPHDYGTKKGHVERFLNAGDKVKVTIMFRGREQSRPELGFRLLQRLAEDIAELGYVESAPKQDGRNMIMVLGPTKKKAEAKAAQRRQKEDRRAAAAGGDADSSLDDLVQPAPQVEPQTDEVPAASTEAPVAPVAPVVETAPEPAAQDAAPPDVATLEPATSETAVEPEIEAPVAESTPAVVPAAPSTPRPASPRSAAPKPGAPKPAAPRPAAPKPSKATAAKTTASKTASKATTPRPSAPKPGAAKPGPPAS